MRYKLYPELIPKSNWGYNLRSYLKPEEWKSISKYIRDKANGVCEICKNTSDKLEAHELWTYDDEEHIQALERVVAVCPLCHRAYHIGQTLSQNNPYIISATLSHIKAVNHCNNNQLNKLIEDIKDKWRERSQYDWVVMVDDELLEDLLSKGSDYL